MNSVILGGQTVEDFFNEAEHSSQTLLRNYVSTVEDSNLSLEGFLENSDSLIDSLEEVNNSFSTGGFASVLKNLGINTIGSILSYLISLGFDHLWNNVLPTEAHKRKIAESAEEIANTYKSAIDEVSSDMSSIEKIQNEFAELSRGVNSMGENVSLTTDEYERYRTIVDQIISINPRLIEGYNSENEAIINNNTALQETIDLLKEKEKIANIEFTTDENLAVTFENIKNQTKDLGKEIEDLAKNKRLLGATTNLGNTLSDSNFYNNIKDHSVKIDKSDQDKLNQIFANLDVNKINLANGTEMSQYDYLFFLSENIGEVNNALDVFKEISNKYKGVNLFDNLEVADDSIRAIQEASIQLKMLRSEIETTEKQYNSALQTYATTFDEYSDMTNEQRLLTNYYIQGYDFDASDIEDGISKAKADIREMVNTISEGGADIQVPLSVAFDSDNLTLDYNSYRDTIDTALKLVADYFKKQGNEDFDELNEVKIALGFSIETEDGTVKDNAEEAYKRVLAKVQGLLDENGNTILISSAKLAELNVEQIKQLADVNFDDAGLRTWADVIDYLGAKLAGFSIETYKDSIDDVQSKLTSLNGALQKLGSGEITADEVLDLTQEFNGLSKYVDYTDKSFGNLAEGIKSFIQSTPEGLISELISEAENATPEAKEEIYSLIEAIRLLQKNALDVDLSEFARLGLTASDFLDYKTNQIDDIIDKINEEIEAQKKVLEELEKQQEAMEKLIEKYETAADVATNTIDTQISDIQDEYEKRIAAIQKENEARNYNIELQEKQAAFENAKKTKVRRYSESRGWVYENDSTAINKTINDLDELKNEIEINRLEEERDAKIQPLEDYKKLWEDAISAWENAQNEGIATEVFGKDWFNKVLNQDKSLLNYWSKNYSGYQNSLNNDINQKIEAQEKAIEKNEDIVAEWEKEKESYSNFVDNMQNEQQRYLESIDNVKLTEKSSYEERIQALAKFKQQYAALSKFEEMTPEDLASAGLYTLTLDGNTIATATNEKDIQAQRDKYIAKLAAEEMAKTHNIFDIANVPVKIANRLKIVKPYSNGGIGDYTGLAMLHGTKQKSETIFNADQSKKLLDFVNSNKLELITKANETLNSIIDLMPKVTTGDLGIIGQNINSKTTTPSNPNISNTNNSPTTNIVFNNPVINAESYEQFSAYMDRFTNEAMMNFQVGK